MNKKLRNDFILIGILLIICLGIFLGVHFYNKNKENGSLIAHVYYKDELILEIDLTSLTEEKIETVTGEISDVVIVFNHNSVYVSESGCPDHICINEGVVTQSGKSIVCMPNKIYITLTGSGGDA